MQYAKQTSWSSGNAFLSGAGNMRFKSRPVKSDTVLPTARHRCDISSKDAVFHGVMMRRWAPPTRYTLQRKVASTRKDLIKPLRTVFLTLKVNIIFLYSSMFVGVEYSQTANPWTIVAVVSTFYPFFFFFFFFFLHCPLFREGCGGSSSRLSRQTSRSSITSIISLGRSPKRFHPRSSM